jgi:hypothetical protein
MDKNNSKVKETNSISLLFNSKRSSISSNFRSSKEKHSRLNTNRYDLLGTKKFRTSINKKKSLSEEKFDELTNKVNKSKSSKRSLNSLQSQSIEIPINKSTVRGLYGLYQGVTAGKLDGDNKNKLVDKQFEDSKYFLFSKNKQSNEDNTLINELKKCKYKD